MTLFDLHKTLVLIGTASVFLPSRVSSQYSCTGVQKSNIYFTIIICCNSLVLPERTGLDECVIRAEGSKEQT